MQLSLHKDAAYCCIDIPKKMQSGKWPYHLAKDQSVHYNGYGHQKINAHSDEKIETPKSFNLNQITMLSFIWWAQTRPNWTPFFRWVTSSPQSTFILGNQPMIFLVDNGRELSTLKSFLCQKFIITRTTGTLASHPFARHKLAPWEDLFSIPR